MELILSLIPVVFASNLIMSGVKYLAFIKESKIWLRGVLIAISVLGIVAHGVLSGAPINFNEVSDLTKALVEIVGVSLVAHLNYRAIKTA